MKKIFLIVVFTSSCGIDVKCEGYQCNIDNVWNHEIEETIYTSKGIEVDTSGQDIDLNLLDTMTDNLEECLADIGTLPDKEVEDAWCPDRIMPREIKRECLTVKVPNNWMMSCDGKEQILKNKAPIEGCRQKGFEKDPNCPCRWRAAIQDAHIIVVTPNLKLYGDPLVKIVTGCYSPWSSKKLSQCLSASVRLSQGISDDDQ